MAEIVQGTVVSLIAGYYDVQTPAGVVRTRARGVFRKNREKPQVGDSVAASTARMVKAAGLPDCRKVGLMSGVLTKKFGR